MTPIHCPLHGERQLTVIGLKGDHRLARANNATGAAAGSLSCGDSSLIECLLRCLNASCYCYSTRNVGS